MKNEALERIKKRLTNGQKWLISYYDAYMDDEMDPKEWYTAFDLWDGLDCILRLVYRHEGCSVGQCKEGPIVCRGCVTSDKGEIVPPSCSRNAT